ncbi:MAG: 50S ribosomal protein L13 [Bacteroidetes bacterium GWA2_31_9]|nr:MAG: 50S ribosomal protein L13 [Bacteroidetes bacterium GWA2_31_9]
MDTLSYKTISSNKATVNKNWVIVDVQDVILGRACTKIASLLRGKYKTNFSPHVDCGDNVIVLNTEKISLSGLKLENKEYITYSGYPGGQKSQTPEELLKKNPKLLVERAVKGMLPKNRLGRELFRNLHVYIGTEHPHEAQQPTKLDLNSIK